MIALLDPDKWKFSDGTKVKAIILAANLLFFWWLFTAATLKGFLIGFVGYLFIAKIGGDIGMHRYFAHRSFKARPWAHKLFLFLTIPVSFGSALSWTAAHRRHHETSDTPEDPHSPNQIGGVRVWALLLGDKWSAGPKYIKDLMRDKSHLFLYRNYFKLYAAWMGALGLVAAFLGWEWFVYLWALPVCLVMHASSAVNVICHRWGYRTYDTPDNSRNNLWLNLLLFGNAMHNNHHGNPSSYDLGGSKWYEVDVWAYLIRWVLMDPSDKNFVRSGR